MRLIAAEATRTVVVGMEGWQPAGAVRVGAQADVGDGGFRPLTKGAGALVVELIGAAARPWAVDAEHPASNGKTSAPTASRLLMIL